MPNKEIRFFDMFAGVGGFRAGLERAGGYTCIGHCEIDKHADKAYRAIHNIKESEVFYEDATKIDPDTMPEFDLLCAGFPCQSFSVAGKRKGFQDPRGTMFFEIARVVEARRPSYLLLENVPGLLSHDEGRTFTTILATLNDLGYSVEWQVLNSKDFGVPQSRRRVFIVGYLNPECAGKVLPVRDTNAKALKCLIGGRRDSRVYDPDGLSNTLLARAGGFGGKSGLYAVGEIDSRGFDTAHAVMTPDREKVRQQGRRIKDAEEPMFTLTSQDRHGVLLIKEATKTGYKEAHPGDSIDLGYIDINSRRGRVGKGIAHTIVTGGSQGVMTKCGRIRRLTPQECFCCQGFSEEQIDKLLSINSDAQAYKQAGNAVTVNVIHDIGLRLKAAHEAIVAATWARKEAA